MTTPSRLFPAAVPTPHGAGLTDAAFRQFFDHHPSPVLIHAPDTLQILEVNQAALAMYGYSRAELLALTVHDLWPARNLDKALYDGSPPVTPKASAGPVGQRQRHCCRDGSLIDVELQCLNFVLAQGPVVLMALRNVTRMVQTGQELLWVSGMQRLLSACNEVLVRVDERQDMLRQLCELAVRVGGYRLAWVGMARRDDAALLNPVASAGDTGYLTGTVFSWAQGARGFSPLAYQAMTTGTVAIAQDLPQAGAPWPARARRHGLVSAICLPLFEDDRVIGVFSLYAAEAIQTSTTGMRLLQTLVDDLAFGLGRMRDLEEQRRIQSAMLQVAAAVSSHSGRAFFEQLVRHMLDVLGACAGSIAALQPDNTLRALVTIVDGRVRPETGATAEDSGVQDVSRQVRWMAPEAAPASLRAGHAAQSCVAYRVDDAHGTPIGLLFAVLEHVPKQRDFILSILRIFAASAASEMQRQEAMREISQLALFDALTGLPNRKHLMDRMEQALRRARREGGAGAVLFIDLDNFKTINDSLGHDKGDQLLTQVASRLRACVRASDLVGRLGGDEFVVMLEGLGTEPARLARQAQRVARTILGALKASYRIDGYTYENTASIGIAAFHGHGQTVGDLMKQADMAMYQAKEAGRNGVCFFGRRMQADMMARALLEMDLRQALARQEFILHFQPQSDREGRVTGVEALVRWNHPSKGLVPPARFIPVAEETGLIGALGSWVLGRACERLAQWAAQPQTAGLLMAVNISVREFKHPRFVDQVRRILRRTGANPARLQLELTESLMVGDMATTVEKMVALREMGISLALDDFGTGYSSLSYLKRLPLDQIKIDRSFIQDATASATDGAIVHSIFALGRHLGLSVVAEGVETAEHRAFVLAQGCQCYQGYYFSPPLPEAQLCEFLAAVGTVPGGAGTVRAVPLA